MEWKAGQVVREETSFCLEGKGFGRGLLLFLCVLLVSLAGGAPPVHSAGPAAVDGAGQFTISAFETKGGNNTLRIRFSKPVPLHRIDDFLKIYPDPGINWRSARMEGNDTILVLTAKFKPGSRYVVSIDGAKTGDGRKYVPTLRDFTVPDHPASLSFAEEGSVIERDSRQMIHLKVRNVDELLYEGLRVPPLLFPMVKSLDGMAGDRIGMKRALEELKSSAGAAALLAAGEKEFSPFLGDVSFQKQVFFPDGVRNSTEPFSVPLGFREKADAGALELVRFSSNAHDDKVSTPFRMLRITDMAITYKVSAEEILIWVTSLSRGLPLAGARILGFDKGAGAYHLGVTDGDGILKFRKGEYRGLSPGKSGEFSMVQKELAAGDLAFVMAGLDGDVTYADIQESGNVKPERIVQVKGLRGGSVRLLKGHVFTERGIYRPGDTVHFKGTLREFADGEITAPAGREISLTLLNAKNEKVVDRTVTVNEFGTLSGEQEIKSFYPLGTYTLTMQFGPEEGDKVSRTFQVQEFRAPRHFTEVSFKRITRSDPAYVNMEKELDLLQVDIGGRYYAGGPVKHGKVRWKIYLSRTDHQVKGFDTFTFGDPMGEKGELLESGESLLDEKGNIRIEFPVGWEVKNGVNGLLVAATVLDFDGRVATEQHVYQARPEYLVGIEVHPDKVAVEDEQSLRLVVLNRKGKAIKKGRVRVDVMRKEYTYIRKRNEEGNVYYDWQQVWVSGLSGDLPIEKKSREASFGFSFGYGGKYRLRFTYLDDRGNRYASSTYYDLGHNYYWRDRKRQEKTYDSLPMSADRGSYRPGETAHVRLSVRRPPSRYLVTLEQDGILDYRVVKPEGRGDLLDVPVTDLHAPNVYLSVVALLPRGSFPHYKGKYDEEAPSFLFGTLNLPVRRESADMKVVINGGAVKLKGEPGGEMVLALEAADDDGNGLVAELAVAVVDERVLALTGYETPSLEGLTRFTGPLGVFTGEMRTALVHQTPFDIVGREELTGGGGLARDPDSASTRVRKDFNPVAYFNPSVVTDDQGKARVVFTLPDTMTTYRVYVVACDTRNRFASVQKPLLAVQDFYLEAGMPRFFTVGDRFRFNVSAFNKTDVDGAVSFSLTGADGLELSTEKPGYNLKGMDSVKIPVFGEASRSGDAVVAFSADMGTERDALQLTIPVKSGHVLGTEVVQGSFRGRKEISFPLPREVRETDWAALGTGEVSAVLTVSGSPFLRMSRGLRYLLGYPYGCVEQTSSRVLPLAALRGLIEEGMVPEISLAETDKFLKSGVERLLSMQTRSGGFGYWPGYRDPHPWGTIYAMSALSVARAKGFEIQEDLMQKAFKYLREQVKKGEKGATFDGFAAYILAMNGELDGETFRRARSMTRDPSREARLLAELAAISRGGPEASAAPSNIRKILQSGRDRNRSYSFYARYREPAIALLAATAAMRDDPVTDEVALRLTGGIGSNGIWTSTSDTGWSLFALGEYYRGTAFAEGTVTVTVGQEGRQVDSVKLEPAGYRTIGLDAAAFVANPVIAVTTNSDREFLYSLSLTAPRVDYATNGYSNGFEVTKTIENTDGGSVIRLGDVVKVKVNIVADRSYGGAYRIMEYVVVDDPLPAGLVAINSALKTEEPVGDENEDSYYSRYWTGDGYGKFVPNFFEIRDDRVLVFRDRLWSGRYQYVYYARAVTEGEFVMPPTKVQLMYSPERAGYSPRAVVAIGGR